MKSIFSEEVASACLQAISLNTAQYLMRGLPLNLWEQYQLRDKFLCFCLLETHLCLFMVALIFRLKSSMTMPICGVGSGCLSWWRAICHLVLE